MTLSKSYIGAILIAAAGIIFWAFLMPLYDGVGAKREAISQRTTLIETRGGIINNIKELAQEYSKRSSDISHFASVVPAVKSAPELLSSIQALATQNGLQLTTIALSGSINQNISAYQEQSIDLGLNGSYPAFKSFLMAVERNIRLIDVLSVDASPSSENSDIITFRVKGTAYYLK